MLLFKRENRRILFLAAFLGYLLLLTYWMFFAESFGRTPGNHGYNLVPFQEIRRFLTYYDVLGMEAVLINLAGNVLAFLPFGFFVPALMQDYKRQRMGLLATFLCTLGFSLMLEVVQRMTDLGSFDVDDMILNSLGGILGYLLYRFAKGLARRIYAEQKEKSGSSF